MEEIVNTPDSSAVLYLKKYEQNGKKKFSNLINFVKLMDKWTKADEASGKSELQLSARNRLHPETDPKVVDQMAQDRFRQTAEYNSVDRFNYDEQFWNFLPFHTLRSKLA